ncbi:MAG: L,D-transpeptidase family protein [Ilumatobacteraceae bacterium]
MSASPPAERAYGKILPALAAVALIGTVVIAGGISGGNDDRASSSAVPTTPTTVAAPTTTALATTTTAPKTTITQTLSRGMAGPEVQALQQRLTDLGFQVGVVDGQYGKLTQGAVWAFETLVEGKLQKEATGVVTPERWLLLQDPLPALARRPEAGKHTEIYLPQQALVVYEGASPLFITHISSGELEPPGDDFTKGNEWCEEVTIDPGENGNVDGTEPIKKGVCGNAWTPGGVYEFYRKVEGVRQSRLGGMRNPVYFNYGIAVHGAYEVPDHPASHGCIRLDNSYSETFQNLVNVGEQVFVWDGVKEPENYGAQSGLWDWNDPNYTTTTTTTTAPPTTTVPPTTTRVTPTAAPVTPAATTTLPPAETTTTAPVAPG